MVGVPVFKTPTPVTNWRTGSAAWTPPTPISAKCGCVTDVSSPPICSHHRRISLLQSPLAARAGASSVQDCLPDIISYGLAHVPQYSIASLTCLAVELFVLLALTVWLCRLSGCQPLPTRLSWLSVHESGTIYRLM